MFFDNYFWLDDVGGNISRLGPLHGGLRYRPFRYTEYSFRAMYKGVPIYISSSVMLKHEVGKRADHRFLFLKLIQWNTNPLRQYYSARNCIHIVRRYGAQFPLLVLVNIITVQQILSVAVYENEKRKKFVAMPAGIMDGLRGRYGSFESCWPRTSTFCTKPGN